MIVDSDESIMSLKRRLARRFRFPIGSQVVKHYEIEMANHSCFSDYKIYSYVMLNLELKITKRKKLGQSKIQVWNCTFTQLWLNKQLHFFSFAVIGNTKCNHEIHVQVDPEGMLICIRVHAPFIYTSFWSSCMQNSGRPQSMFVMKV